jgi:hypothetical protein
MKRPWFGFALLVLVTVPVGSWAVELPRGCFRSVAEAVAQTHALEPAGIGIERLSSGLGFRLEDVRRDALLNKSWAIVRNCEHPEYPAVVVVVPGSVKAEAGAAAGAAPPAAALTVKAGVTVRLVRNEANVRMEMPAVTVSGGMLGERIQARVVRSTGNTAGFGSGGFEGGNELIVVGIVRGPDVLEMEQ